MVGSERRVGDVMIIRRWCMGVMFGAILAGVSGCRSAYVEADVRNATDRPVRLVEVDYPSASFGVESLAAGAVYHYRFKILGDGATKVMWTDGAQKEHSVAGPALKEGQQGGLTVVIGGESATWQSSLQP